ncbi:hypothetical protein ACFL3S_01305 [Gemmatimonadota bacterium]
MGDLRVDPVSIDVGRLVRRNVAALYSSLVTRPTGQAVRLAIENVLAEETGTIGLSIIDFSQVTVIDFSCADEVVAKLLLRFREPDPPREAFFIFRGIQELHRDPIEVVLQRHSLAAVAQTPDGSFELLGSTPWDQEQVWMALQARGRVRATEVDTLLPDGQAAVAMEALVGLKVVFRSPHPVEFRALSTLLPTQM